MKKKLLIIIRIILIVFVIIKMYHFVIIVNTRNSLNSFRKENNRCYIVETVKSNSIKSIDEIFLYNNIIKYNKYNDNKLKYFEWKDFNESKSYTVKNDDEILLNSNRFTMLNYVENLYNLPNLVVSNNYLKHLFQIHYIIPTTYNGEKCFKIVTGAEEIIIDSNTFLPVHLIKKNYNSNNNLENCIEYNYIFEIGTVTDEDVALPNLSEYKLID